MIMTASMSAPSNTATEMPPLRPIRSDDDHTWAMREVERLWGAKLGTPEGDRLDILATLIDAYESQRWPISAPDPIAAIEFTLEQRGMTRDDLVPLIGSAVQVAEVLDRKRELTLEMVRRLRETLGISADVLVGPVGR